MVFLYSAGIIVLLAAAVILARAAACRSTEISEAPTVTSLPPAERAVGHLSEALRIPTVSPGDHRQAFADFAAWLEQTYPLVHSSFDLTTAAEYTRMYHWKGRDNTLKPVLLIAHQDVVAPGDPSCWSVPPFSGEQSGGFVWGRGALDMKGQLIALLESAEWLLAQGFQPKRSIYLVFGHDEESRGDGAKEAAQYFRDQGITFQLLLDEGGLVSEQVIPGLSRPAATTGIAEKGYLDVKLTCTMPGGHSSMPRRRTSLGILAEVLADIERRQFPLRLTPVSRLFFQAVRPHMPFSYRLILANLPLFSPLFLRYLSRIPVGNAMVRTTTAVTMAAGSDAPNKLPAVSTAMVNFRLLHGDDEQRVLAHVRSCIGSRPVTCEAVRSQLPSRISDPESSGYYLVRRTIRQVFPEAVTVPYLMTGGTDARAYEDLADAVCRFSPYRLSQDEINRMHASDERISYENIERAVRFYLQLLENLQN